MTQRQSITMTLQLRHYWMIIGLMFAVAFTGCGASMSYDPKIESSEKVSALRFFPLWARW